MDGHDCIFMSVWEVKFIHENYCVRPVLHKV